MSKQSTFIDAAEKSFKNFFGSTEPTSLEEISKEWSQEEAGLPIFFLEGEKVYFKKAFRTRGFKTSKGATVRLGEIACYTEQCDWRWCPLAVFRPQPSVDKRSELYDLENNSFGVKLLDSMKDSKRAEMLQGKTLTVHVRVLDRPAWDKEKNAPSLDQKRNYKCYLWSK